MPRRRTELDFPSVSIEGGLFPGDFLARIAHLEAAEQSESDYRIPKKLRLRDELGRYFRIAEGLWQDFSSLAAGKVRDSRKKTVETFLLPFFRQVIGFEDIVPVGAMKLDGRDFPIGHSALAGRVPLVFASRDEDLDAPSERYGDEHRRRSPFVLSQEYLNAGGALWATVSNGRVLRVLRANPSLTRPAYLEFDLQRMFEERLYPDFAVLWLTCHASRFGAAGATPSDCALERWKGAAQQEGTRARERLRFGVADALRELGTGFLSVPGNSLLRQKIEQGTLGSDAFYQQLLRLIYRVLFLFTIEERGHVHPEGSSPDAVELYRSGYSLANLRGLASKRRRFDRHLDLWQALAITFASLQKGEPALGLPPLGGLFRFSECPDLDSADLPNSALLQAIYRLAFFVEDGALVRVNYRDMGPEELGSVYEALLELVPEVDTASHPWQFRFVGDDAPAGEGAVSGNARRLTGSYYTPDSLVQELIKSALEPVIAERLNGAEDPAGALLKIRVLDPACGSGHFLLAAARKLAEHLARVRVAGGEPRPIDYRKALREVIAHCIFGVDRNALALELARTALWLESFSAERPLGFLDHHLRCGDALIGVLDPKIMRDGIPDEAFKALAGDEREVARELGRKNNTARKALARERERLAVMQELAVYEAEGGRLLETMPEDNVDQVEAKREAFQQAHRAAESSRARRLADCFVAAFFASKTGETKATVPTTEDLHRILRDVSPRSGTSDAIEECSRKAQAFHWQLEFADVMQDGGFEVLLGNPPWERIKLQEEEFFASRDAVIANAGNKAERTRLINQLATGSTVERSLYRSFIVAKQSSEAASIYAHDSGRFPLTGVGDINTYALFAETFAALLAPKGRAGFIVPTGIATDDSTKGYFDMLCRDGRLVTMLSFENEEFVFPGVHHSYRFCLLTLSGRQANNAEAEFVFYARQPSHIHVAERRFSLSARDIALLNPNSKTCPTFRSKADAELTKKIYRRIAVLCEEGTPAGDPWGMRFIRMFDMAGDSGLFFREPDTSRLPLYEAKMIEQYDHRAGSYGGRGTERGFRVLPQTPLTSYKDPSYCVTPFYWVERSDVAERLAEKWPYQWLIGYKDVTSAVAYRTFISTVIPLAGAGHTLPLLVPTVADVRLLACLLANCNSLVTDYVARQKIGYIHMTYSYVKQLPIVAPSVYSAREIDFIVLRVLELTYVAHDLDAWARDLGCRGQPFAWSPERRAVVKAELDAFFARMYGLTRDELRYILDPADTLGANYPSETFRVLKNSEEREFGEYRTRRLVLEAWDRLDASARGPQMRAEGSARR